MRIYDRDLTGTTAAESGRSAETQKADREAAPAAGAAGTAGDRVEFSSGLAGVARALGTYQQDRAGTVQTLAAQFQSGDYQPDSQATSRGMVAEALRAGAS